MWPALWAHADSAELKQISDLIGHSKPKWERFNFIIVSNGTLVVTALKLQSDWDAQIPFPRPWIVSISLFSPREWGLD